MPRKTTRDNFRVEVYPRKPGDYGSVSLPNRWFPETEQETEGRCKAIAEQIERHVDDLPTRGGKTVVAWDSEHTCEFCGTDWTGKDKDYNGGCCDEDEEHSPEKPKEQECQLTPHSTDLTK